MEKPLRKKSGSGGTDGPRARPLVPPEVPWWDFTDAQLGWGALIRTWFEIAVFSVCGVSQPLTEPSSTRSRLQRRPGPGLTSPLSNPAGYLSSGFEELNPKQEKGMRTFLRLGLSPKITRGKIRAAERLFKAWHALGADCSGDTRTNQKSQEREGRFRDRKFY